MGGATVIGKTIEGYRIVTELGSGPTGEIWFAERTEGEGRAAIKVLRPDLCSHRDRVEAVVAEIHAVNELHHPGIAAVEAVGEVDDSTFVVEELLEGESLEERLERKDRPHAREVARIGALVADAVQAAHEAGMYLHRGLKPQNVFVVGDGVKITDFGVDLLLADSEPVASAVRYAAPEVCRGDGAVDHRADVYSLGALLYHLATGRPPFEGDDADQLVVAHTTEEPKPAQEVAPNVPGWLDECLTRALAKDPDDRFESMGAFADALREGLERLPPPPAPPGEGGRPMVPRPPPPAVPMPAAKPGPKPASEGPELTMESLPPEALESLPPEAMEPPAEELEAAVQETAAPAQETAELAQETAELAQETAEPQAEEPEAKVEEPEAKAEEPEAKAEEPEAKVEEAEAAEPEVEEAEAAEPEVEEAEAAEPEIDVAEPEAEEPEVEEAEAAEPEVEEAEAEEAEAESPEPGAEEKRDSKIRLFNSEPPPLEERQRRVIDKLSRAIVQRVVSGSLELPPAPEGVTAFARLVTQTSSEIDAAEVLESDEELKALLDDRWESALFVAALAHGLALATGDEVDPRLAYLAPLVLEAGRPLVREALPKVETKLKEPDSKYLNDQVRDEVIELCHREVAVSLAYAWGLPPTIPQALPTAGTLTPDDPKSLQNVLTLAIALAMEAGRFTGQVGVADLVEHLEKGRALVGADEAACEKLVADASAG